MPTGKVDFDVERFLAKAGAGRMVSTYAKGEPIYAQGEAADAIFYIQEGQVKVSATSAQGKEAVVALLNRHEFFGEGCLAGQTWRTAAATPMTDCEIMRLEKAAILQLIYDEPEFAQKFIGHILVRGIRIEEDLVDQMFNSSEKRLARTLLLLSNFGKDGAPELILPKINQETLAEMIGTTRSRVSAFMNKFRRLGYIDYNGGIHVHSSLLNVVLLDRSPDDAEE